MQYIIRYIFLPIQDNLFGLRYTTNILLFIVYLNKNNSSKRVTSLIRVIGVHPDGGEIHLMDGKFGPYIKHKKNNVGIKNKDKLEEIDLNISLKLLNSKKKK